MIRFKKFGGIIPRLDEAALPDHCAAVAHNVDLTGGVLRPLKVAGDFSQLHDSNGVLLPGLPPADVKTLAQPAKPVLSLPHLCRPENWLTITARDWLTWIDDETGLRQVVLSREHSMTVLDWWYTETGFDLVALLPPVTYTIFAGAPVTLSGPKYQFHFAEDSGGLNGGPEREIHAPYYFTEDDPELPPDRIPLYDPDRNVYAYFEVADVHGPKFDETYVVTDFDQIVFEMPAYPAAVHFTINLNYAEPRRRFVHYVWSVMTSDDEEGPPSELSDRATVPPGCVVELALQRPPSTPGAAYKKARVYRSGTGGDDFRLVKEFRLPDENFTWRDRLHATLPEPVPPYGNPPGNRKDVLLEGSVLHPGQFGCAKWDKELWFSDVMRLYAWPKETSLPYTEPIKAICGVGNTVLVWLGDRLYAVSGSHPAQMASYLLSETAGLLTPESLCRIGDEVFYAAADGLAAATAGGVRIISKEFFNREQWGTFGPERVRTKTADGALFFEPQVGTSGDGRGSSAHIFARLARMGASVSSNLVNLVFRFGEQENTLATYDTLTGGTLAWKSKTFHFDTPQRFEWVAAAVDGTATIQLWADGELRGAREFSSHCVPEYFENMPAARDWAIGVLGTGTVSEIVVQERIVLPMGESVRLTADTMPLWTEAYLKFPGTGSIRAGSVESEWPLTLEISVDGGDATTITVDPGRAFRLPRVYGSEWRVRLQTPDYLVEAILLSEQSVPVDGDFRDVNQGVPPWFFHRYLVAEQRSIKSAMVLSDSYPLTMTLIVDDVARDIEIRGPEEVRLAVRAGARTVEYHFNDMDYAVREVRMIVAQPIPMGSEPYQASMPGSVRAQLFSFAAPERLACLQVRASDYSMLTCTVYRDGAQVFSSRVYDGEIVALPRTVGSGLLWEVDFDTDAEIWGYTVWPMRSVRVDSPYLLLGVDNGLPEWQWTRWVFAAPQTLMSVFTDSANTVDLYADASNSPKTVYLSNDQETGVWDSGTFRTLEIACLDASTVKKLYLFFRDSQPIGESGLYLADRLNWRRLLFHFSAPDRFVACMAAADGVVVVTLRADGVQVWESAISNGNPVNLPALAAGVYWEVDVAAGPGIHVDQVILLPRQVVQAGGIIHEARSGGIPRWMYLEYDLPDETHIRAARVLADAYPVTLTLTADEVSQTVSVENSRPFPLYSQCSRLRYHFAGGDAGVREVSLYSDKVRMVGDGIFLTDELCWVGMRFKFADIGQFAAAVVGASDYTSVVLTLRADGVQVYSQPVTDGRAFRLPRDLPRATWWTVDLVTEAEVSSLILMPLVDRVQADPVIFEHASGPIPIWLYTRYLFTAPPELLSAWVASHDTTVVMTLETADLTKAETFTHDTDELRFDGVFPAPYFEFHFDGADNLVAEVAIFFSALAPVRSEPLFLTIAKPVHWRRLGFAFAERGQFALIQVLAFSYSGVEIDVWGAGRKVFHSAVQDTALIRLPRTGLQTQWEIDVPNQSMAVQQINLWPRVRQQVDGGTVRLVNRDCDVPPWLWSEYDFPARVVLRSMLYEGSAPFVTANVYLDGATTPIRVLLTADREALLALPACSSVGIDFDGDDAMVGEVYLYCEELVPLGNSGLVLRGAGPGTGWRNKTASFPNMGTWNVARVSATDYTDCHLDLRPKGGYTYSFHVTDAHDFLLAGLPPARDWDFGVRHSGEVRELILLSREEAPIENKIVVVREQEPFSWLGHRFRANTPVSFSAGRVLADAYPLTLRVFAEEQLVIEREVQSGEAFRLPRLRPERHWRVDVISTAVVREVVLAGSLSEVRAHG